MMGQQTDIEIFFHGKAVNQAEQVVADMIKLYYLDGITTLVQIDKVYNAFLRKRETLRKYPEADLLREFPYCVLKGLSTCGNTIYISRCSELQCYLSPVETNYSGFFYDVCFALAREFPTVKFSATSRFHMTVTDHVETTTAYFDTEHLTFEKVSKFLSYDDSDDDDDDNSCCDDGYSRGVARWKLLPRCIAVNGTEKGAVKP